MSYLSIESLLGKTLVAVTGEVGGEKITFTTTEGEEYLMYHSQDCCESVSVDDICGDLQNLIGSPILIAREDTNSDQPRDEEYRDESFTWTFYNIATVKGHVTIKWYGSSNGYYSESVDFKKV